jgi:hypothetical protein
MLKRYRFWLSCVVGFQLLVAAVHSIGLFIKPTSEDPIERQMLDLMMNHKMSMGPGFHPSMFNLFIALSSCFTLMCLLAALTNIVLLRQRSDATTIKGLVAVQLIIFAITLAVMSALTFLLPIVSISLIVITLLVTLLTIRNTDVGTNT